jgi:hypothetical protein
MPVLRWKRFAAWAPALALGGVLYVPSAPAVEPVALPGTLAGLVTNAAGIPQMGAVVVLLNRYERIVGRGITNDRGGFEFTALPADLYSLRVTLSSFVPVVKRNIAIQPGMRSFLAVNLASLFSTVELVYIAPSQAAVMSEDWKWVLRGSGATRPVLRILPTVDISDPAGNRQRASIFSDTRGMVRVSAGDGGAMTAAGSQTDLGTAFALATSVFGSNKVAVSGNVGYGASTGIPAAGFSTSFQRQSGSEGVGPEVNVTMRQLFLPAAAGQALMTRGASGAPVLRSMSVTMADERRIGDGLTVEYGSTLESVTYVERLNVVSPFARVRWGTRRTGTVEAAYSNGAPPMRLLGLDGSPDAEMQQQLSALSLFPRLSLRGGHTHVQRTENFEVSYRRTVGSREFAAGVFRESVSNAAMTMAAPAGFYGTADLLPDLASPSSVFNIGSFRRMGYLATASQQINENLSATLGLLLGDGLTAAGQVMTDNPDELRSGMSRTRRGAVSARVSATLPRTGTQLVSSYLWTDYRVLSPVHLSMTQRSRFDPGLNLYLRQPIPGGSVFSGRLEATAELRNLLAQGYVPVYAADGRRLLLIHSPRAVRGGLAFIF